MTISEDRRGRRYASACLAALAGIMLTAGGAAAQAGDYSTDISGDYDTDITGDYGTDITEDTSDIGSDLGSDTELYDAYDAGFDDVDTDNDWFYDYYELDDTQLGTGIGMDTTVGDDVYEDDLDMGFDTGFDDDFDLDGDVDDDATDLGTDDAGDEGFWDL